MRSFATAVLIALAAAAARGDDWTHLGRDEQRSRAPVEALQSLALHGSMPSGSESVASAVAADGYLVTAGLDGVVRGWRESDRAALWSASLDSPIIATPAIRRGRVYVALTGGVLKILRLVDGVLLGELATGGADRSSPIFSADSLYLGSGFPNTALLAIDPDAAAPRWSAALDQVTDSSPLAAAGKIIIATNSGSLSAFDAASGAPAWTATIGGSVRTASPLQFGSSVFVISDATLSRVELDPLDWASNAGVGFTDPLPAPANAQDVDWAASSLAVSGGVLFGVVRFDYPLDLDADGYLDSWTLREYAVAVDPASLSILWQVPLGSVTVPDQNGIPAYRLVPSPVATGTDVAFASSVDASLRLLSPADGSTQGSFALDAPCQASPFVANARLYALSKAGVLHAWQGATPQPAAAASLSPNGGNLVATPGALSWTASTPGATYLIRIARDGEILMDWDLEFSSASPSIACPPLADGFNYTWGVRVQDPSGAWGPWSLSAFGQNVPPDAPAGLTAVPDHSRVLLSWTPDAGASGYRLEYGPSGAAPTKTLDLGPVASTRVNGLRNGVSYDFSLRAIGPTGLLSAPAVATATPVSKIHIGHKGYDSLLEAAADAHGVRTIRLGADVFVLDRTLRLGRGVTLAGDHAFATRIEAAGLFTMIVADDGAEIRGLSLSGGSVGVEAGDATIANCVIHDMSDAGVIALGGTRIVNNTIVRNGGCGVRATGPSQARNNIVQDNRVGFSGTLKSSFNDVSDGYADGARAGHGDQQAPVRFRDLAAGDYREQAGQASLDAGDLRDEYQNEPPNNGARVNLGAFGNTALAATTDASESSTSSAACAASIQPGAFGVEALSAALVALLLLRRRR